MNQIKIIKAKAGGKSNVEVVRQVWLNGVKLKAVQGITMSASTDNIGIMEVDIKLFANLDIVEAK